MSKAAKSIRKGLEEGPFNGRSGSHESAELAMSLTIR